MYCMITLGMPPFHHQVLAVNMGFSVWSGKHIVNRKYLHETEKTSGKIMGGETRSPCDLMLGSGPRGNRRGAVPTCSECGLSKVLLCSSRKGITHPANPEVASINPVCFILSKLRMPCELWMELFTRESYIFPYSWDVYWCLLIFLLVWISFIIKDLEICTNTEVKIYRCPGLLHFQNGQFRYG